MSLVCTEPSPCCKGVVRDWRRLKALERNELLQRLRAQLARQATFRQASQRLKKPLTTLYRLAERHGLPHRRRGISAEAQSLIIRLARQGLPRREIARRALGVADSTAVASRLRQLRGKLPLRCSPWRCPGGGELMLVSICILHNTRCPPVVSPERAPRQKTRRFIR